LNLKLKLDLKLMEEGKGATHCQLASGLGVPTRTNVAKR